MNDDMPIAVGAQIFATLTTQISEYLAVGDPARALTASAALLAQSPTNAFALHACGIAQLRLGNADAALPYMQHIVREYPEHGLAHSHYGQALAGVGRDLEALLQFDLAQTLGVPGDHLDAHRYQSACQSFQQVCNWQQFDRVHRLVRQAVMASARWLTGEPCLASPYFSNAVLLQAARAHANVIMATRSIGQVPFTHQKPCDKLRLGFVGCDFYTQATAYLMVGFIEALDRERFELYAYDHAPTAADSPFRRRVIAAYDHFVSIDTLSDDAAAGRIHEDRIDVLFSIKNPGGARLGIFMRRPAALQVHYLYYPATSGMPFFDHIIADSVIIPPDLEAAYTESVLRMAGCYQPNDPARPQAVDTNRAQWVLPADAIVMANFGQAYKYTPAIFDLWCALLQRGRKRILWLLCDDESIQSRLRDEARSRGVDPQRLYFTQNAIPTIHLNRLRHADLILDTYPYGGHTVTSDALWAGTPVVTLIGETFASRVAASLLYDVGLGDCVATNELQYLSIADTLLNDANKRKAFRKHLDEGRAQFALFDAKNYAQRFADTIEGAVAARWAD